MDPSKINTVYALLAFIVAAVLAFIGKSRPERWERAILYALVAGVTGGGIYTLTRGSAATPAALAGGGVVSNDASTKRSTPKESSDGTASVEFQFKHMVNQRLCTGRVAKYRTVWSEFIPNDSDCKVVRHSWEELDMLVFGAASSRFVVNAAYASVLMSTPPLLQVHAKLVALA